MMGCFVEIEGVDDGQCWFSMLRYLQQFFKSINVSLFCAAVVDCVYCRNVMKETPLK